MRKSTSSLFLASVSYAVTCIHFCLKYTVKQSNLGSEMARYEAIMHIFKEMKAGQSPGNDDKVTYLFSRIFYWMPGKV